MRLKWIDHPGRGRLAITPRPDGNEALEPQLSAWALAGVNRVVSMLEPDEAEMLGLSREGELCAAHGMVFHNFPVPDHGVPDSAEALVPLVTEIVAGLDRGERIAIHCRAALGRAPLVACSSLIARGVHVDEAILSVGHARKAIIPETEEQARFVKDFAAYVTAHPIERLVPVR
jgi:Predicted protein-tyrosine phosphatase